MYLSKKEAKRHHCKLDTSPTAYEIKTSTETKPLP